MDNLVQFKADEETKKSNVGIMFPTLSIVDKNSTNANCICRFFKEQQQMQMQIAFAIAFVVAFSFDTEFATYTLATDESNPLESNH